jgi:hypothetical protein
MRISKGDYCIAKQEGGKDYLFRALSDNDKKSVEGLLEKGCHIPGQRHTMTVELSDVILNLGPNPHPGKVYGADVGAIHRKRLTHKEFGDVHFFYRPEKKIITDLDASMNRVAAKLNKAGLGFLFNAVLFEVMPYHGEKYAGMCIYAKNEKTPTRIQIRPEAMTPDFYDYIWYHEFGHYLNMFWRPSKKLMANWLKLYSTSIKTETVKKDVSQRLLDLLMDGEDKPSDFKRDLEEEDALAFKWIIRTIGQVSALSIQDLDTLFEAEMKDEIKKVWPLRTIPRKELAPIISEYATVNVRELIAESFAFYMTKKKLPEPVTKLLERSIAYAKANHERPKDND